MFDWEQPRIIREGDHYFFTRPIDDQAGEKIQVTDDVHGWIDQAKQQTSLELAKACLFHASTSTHYQLPGEVRRAILTIFGPEVDAQLQAEFSGKT